MHGENQLTYFFPVLLEEFHSAEFLENVRRKFHFEEEHTDEIRKVAEEMLPVMQKEAFWVSTAYSMRYQGQTQDILQESYSEKGLLMQSYIVEILAGELLMRGYDAYNRSVAAHTDRHVARYHFPGSEEAFPLEILPDLLKDLTQEITCNAAFCMIPKKSVVFVSELTRDDTVHCQGICAGCGNSTCPNRTAADHLIRKRMTDLPLTYGYSRIFGIHT